MKRDLIINIILAILAVHLIYSNSSLLIDMHKIIYEVERLTVLQTVEKYLFALSYSLLTVLIIAVYPKAYLFALTGLFDGFGVYLRYNINQSNFLLLASIYFGVYTTLIVISTGLIAQTREQTGKTKKNINKLESKPKQQNQPTKANKPQRNKHNGTSLTLDNLYDLNLEDLKRLEISIRNSLNRTKDSAKRLEKENKLRLIRSRISELKQ